MAKPLLFDGDLEKVAGFVTACKLYIRIKMRKKSVKEQIHWILIYVQRESTDV